MLRLIYFQWIAYGLGVFYVEKLRWMAGTFSNFTIIIIFR